MEYTKDLILNVRYDEAGSKFKVRHKAWTSSLIKKIKINKTVMAGLIGLLMFVLIDGVLLINFIRVLESV